MAIPPFDPNVQQNFPMAAVIQAAQQNAQRQLEAQTQGNQSIIQGLQSIGQVGQSLLDRRRAMAQALAGAQLYSNTSEGKQMLGTNQVTSGPAGQSVQQGQTASYDNNTGNVTQNKPAIDMNTLATAFYGDKPSDVLKQMFEQHKLTVENSTKLAQIAQTGELTKALTGVKGSEVDVQRQAGLRNSIASERSRQAQAIKDYPELAGTFISNILPKGSNAKESAAFNTYQEAERNIENYNRQLYGNNVSSNGNTPNISINLPGVSW